MKNGVPTGFGSTSSHAALITESNGTVKRPTGAAAVTGQMRTRASQRDAVRRAGLPSGRSPPRMATMLRRCPRSLPGRGGVVLPQGWRTALFRETVQERIWGGYLQPVLSTEFLCPLHVTSLQVQESCDTHCGPTQACVRGLAH